MKNPTVLSFFQPTVSVSKTEIPSSLASLKKSCLNHARHCANIARPSFSRSQNQIHVSSATAPLSLTYNCSFHPHHYAKQMASSKERLSSFSLFKQDSFVLYEKELEKYIQETIFSLLAKTPLLPYSELYFHLEQSIEQLKHLFKMLSLAEIKKISRALLEESSFPLSSRAQKVLTNTPYAAASFLRKSLIPFLIDSPELLKEEFVELFIMQMRKLQYALQTLSIKKITSLTRLLALQSEMLLRSFSFPISSPLYLLCQTAFQKQNSSYQDLLSSICHAFIGSYPFLLSFHEDIRMRSSIFIKHLWYGQEAEPTYNLFLRWHARELDNFSFSKQLEILKKRSENLLPLIPFDEALAKRALIKETQKETE